MRQACRVKGVSKSQYIWASPCAFIRPMQGAGGKLTPTSPENFLVTLHLVYFEFES